MPKACVKKKMKQGMSVGKAVAACYPRATKAAKKVILAAITPGVVRAGVKVAKAAKQRRTIKEIKKSKPPKMKIRKARYGTEDRGVYGKKIGRVGKKKRK